MITNFTFGSSPTLIDNLPPNSLVDGSWTYSRTATVETTGPTALLSVAKTQSASVFFNEATGQYNFGWAASRSRQPWRDNHVHWWIRL